MTWTQITASNLFISYILHVRFCCLIKSKGRQETESGRIMEKMKVNRKTTSQMYNGDEWKQHWIQKDDVKRYALEELEVWRGMMETTQVQLILAVDANCFVITPLFKLKYLCAPESESWHFYLVGQKRDALETTALDWSPVHHRATLTC